MDEQAREQTYFSALTTEHFVMQSVASTTVSESSSRASLYLLTLSSSLVAIGFVAGTPDAFGPFVAAVLPVVFVLGIFTTVRLVDTGVENIQAQRTIARIRRRYAELTPDARVVFAQPTDDVSEEALAMIGVRPGRLLLLFTIASTVGAVNAVVAGIGSVLLVTWLIGAAATPLAVIVGVVVAIVMLGLVIAYQRRRYALMDAAEARRWGDGLDLAGRAPNPPARSIRWRSTRRLAAAAPPQPEFVDARDHKDGDERDEPEERDPAGGRRLISIEDELRRLRRERTEVDHRQEDRTARGEEDPEPRTHRPAPIQKQTTQDQGIDHQACREGIDVWRDRPADGVPPKKVVDVMAECQHEG